MIEILTRDTPYPDLKSFEVAVKVAKEKYVHPIPDHTPPGLAKIMSSCWKYNPDERPTFNQIFDSLSTL